MLKILVTGGTGYIGSHTIVDLIEHGFEPISVDNGINSDSSILDNIFQITGIRVTHYDGDLCNPGVADQIFSEHNLSGVIHFAALKSVGDSVKMPVKYFHNNIDSLLKVIEACLKFNVGNFIFSSSCTVYGNSKEAQVDESTPIQEAVSPYGRTKQMGEQILQDCFSHTDHRSILLRYFNPAGAHPSALMGEAASQVAQNLVPVITETAIGLRKSFDVFGTDYPTRDGSCIRDYIHIMDLAHAHTLALEYLLAAKQDKPIDVYNLGIGQGVSVLEAIKAFESVSNLSLNYNLAPRRPGDVVAIYSDYKKAQSQLGWQPKYDIYDIMRSAWAWEQARRVKS